MDEINNYEDIIDSRDIIKRIEELDDRGGIDVEELNTLRELAEQCEGYGDWYYGEVLIRRSYWVDYVQEMLEDCGDIPKDIPWYIAIDWDKTADNIEADYMSVDFDGVEYLMRSC